MAVKPFRSTVAATPVQAWAPLVSSNMVRLKGGLLGIEVGTAVLPNNIVIAILNGTAAAAGTLAYVPLGGTVTAVGAGPPAVSFTFGDDGVDGTAAGGIAVKIMGNAGAGTITGYLYGKEQRRT